MLAEHFDYDWEQINTAALQLKGYKTDGKGSLGQGEAILQTRAMSHKPRTACLFLQVPKYSCKISKKGHNTLIKDLLMWSSYHCNMGSEDDGKLFSLLSISTTHKSRASKLHSQRFYIDHKIINPKMLQTLRLWSYCQGTATSLLRCKHSRIQSMLIPKAGK